MSDIMALLGLVSKKKDENKDDDYLHVDTGDSLKMKQVLDEACVKAVLTKDYDELHFIDNLKISLMVVACLFAVTAQFYPLPFPASRPLLGVCCSGYFIFSGILQLVVKFVEKDAILDGECQVVTHPKAGARKGLRVRSAFPRYQSDYTIIVQLDEPDAPEMEEKHCVGKFFDADGYFWEQGFIDTVQKLVERFESKKTN